MPTYILDWEYRMHISLHLYRWMHLFSFEQVSCRFGLWHSQSRFLIINNYPKSYNSLFLTKTQFNNIHPFWCLIVNSWLSHLHMAKSNFPFQMICLTYVLQENQSFMLIEFITMDSCFNNSLLIVTNKHYTCKPFMPFMPFKIHSMYFHAPLQFCS